MEVRTQAFTGHKGKWGLGGKGRPRITLKGRQAASGAPAGRLPVRWLLLQRAASPRAWLIPGEGTAPGEGLPGLQLIKGSQEVGGLALSC